LTVPLRPMWWTGRRSADERSLRVRRHVQRLAVHVAAVMASCLLCGIARAEDPARLVYEVDPGAESCGGGEVVLREAVTRLLGYDPFSLSASRTVFVHVERSGTGFAGSVHLVDEAGRATDERWVHAARCDDVVLAVALTASVALDPARAFAIGATPPKAPSPSPPPPTPQRAEASAGASPAENRPHMPWTFSSGVGASLSLGDAPAPVPGAVGYFAARHNALEGELDGRFVFPGSVQTALGVASSWSVEVEAAACIHLGLFLGCPLGQVALVDAHGEVTASRHDVGITGRAGARAGVALPFGKRFELRLEADGLVALTPVTLRISNIPVYKYAPGMVGLTVAGGVRF
jgi:hypothetical protein